MTLSYNDIVALIFVGVILVCFIAYSLTKKRVKKEKTKSNKVENTNTKNNGTENKSTYKKSTADALAKEDVFNFMEFDKIQDDMLIQQKGEKYTAIIKCKGINYNLMSDVEQLAVEEGFMTFLNTLRFPVQLYVQAQSVNLKANIAEYKDNMRDLQDEYDDVNMEYNMVLNSLESTEQEIEDVEDKRNSILNVVEYGKDIIRYVEKMALNKSMLQRSFYLLVSYYKSELSGSSNFKNEELLDICYSELFTRVQNIRSGLIMCSVDTEILGSNEIAELIYSAYNRDDKNFMSVKQALESGFHRLYSTSEDAIKKKHKKLVEDIKREAEYKAIVALNQALDEGTFFTETDAEDEYDQESSRQALELIKKEKLPDEVKASAKKIIVDEYKKAKKERLEKQEEKFEKLKEEIAKYKGEPEETESQEATKEFNDEASIMTESNVTEKKQEETSNDETVV